MTSQKEQLSYLLKSDKDLEELISSIPKIVPFKREKGFEGLVRLICEQQLSVASAKAIFDRLAKIVSPFKAENFLKVSKKDLQETIDALTDILYVTYGAGHAFGVDLDKCFEEVQNSNMSKLGDDGKPIFNEKGKVMKGPNYFKPNLNQFLK